MSYAIYERSKHVGTFNGILTEMNGMIFASPILEPETLTFETAEDAINYVFNYREQVFQQSPERLKLMIHDVVKLDGKIEFMLKLSDKPMAKHPDEFIDKVVHTVE